MESEGAYSFNIAIVGPHDNLNSKFLNLIAEGHGRVDGVEFHQSKIDRVAALIYWQPHQDSVSPILVSHSIKNANGAIVLMVEKNEEIFNKYVDLIKENAGDIPVKEIIFKKNMNNDEIREFSFNAIKELSTQLIIEAEQKSVKEKIKPVSKPSEIRENAGRPQFYIDKFGIVSTIKAPDSIPLYQDERFIKTKKKIGKKPVKSKKKPQKSVKKY